VGPRTGWAPGTVWTGAENLASTGIRSPDRPARSQSLYRLSYPAHTYTCNCIIIHTNTYTYNTYVNIFFSTSCRKILKYQINGNSFIGSRVVPFGRTDGHYEVNNSFSKFWLESIKAVRNGVEGKSLLPIGTREWLFEKAIDFRISPNLRNFLPAQYLSDGTSDKGPVRAFLYIEYVFDIPTKCT
jgi:hypothetical protein